MRYSIQSTIMLYAGIMFVTYSDMFILSLKFGGHNYYSKILLNFVGCEITIDFPVIMVGNQLDWY